MATKERLLLENDDTLTRRLFTLKRRQRQLDLARARHATNQLKQLEFDRIQTKFDDQKASLRRLKEQTARLTQDRA